MRRSLRPVRVELGLRAGIHRTAVGLLERAERVARIDTAAYLATALNVSIGELFAGIADVTGQEATGQPSELSAPIRQARSEDADAVAALWTEAFVIHGTETRTTPYTRKDFSDSSRDGEVFVFDETGSIAGAVVLFAPNTPGRTLGKEGEAELSRLAVSHPARGRGIGRSLACLCEERCRAAGWRAIVLRSSRSQAEAHRLYQSLGYRRVPERDSVDEAIQGRLVFRLSLGGEESRA